MNRMREQFLLHRVRTHQDMEAFRELYEKYVPRIWRFVCSKVPRSEAEELVADTFEKTLVYLTDAPVQNLNALLYRVARRTIADYYRSREGKEVVELEAARNVAAEQIGADEQTDASLDLARVKRALKKLNPGYQDVIRMRYMEGLEIKEIAQALQKTPNTTRVTVHRALAALKAAVAREESE